jgi:hypothetical protein
VFGVLALTGYLADASPTVLEKRLPGLELYSYEGCYIDIPTSITRLLPVLGGYSTTLNLNKCAAVCRAFTYFGVEGGTNCFCGNALRAFPFPIMEPVDTICSIPCASNSAQKCGAAGSLSLYRLNNGAVIPPPPALSYNSLGCYSRPGIQGGGLSGSISDFSMGGLTLAQCEDICRGSNYFAVSGLTCNCGNTINSDILLEQSSGCSTTCGGNSNTICGGNGHSNIYSNIPTCGLLGTALRVKNPGFESGEIGWTASSSIAAGTVKWASRTGTAYAGTRFARIDFFAGARGDFSIEQDVPVCPGTPYILSVYLKRSDSASDCTLNSYIDGIQTSIVSPPITYYNFLAYAVPSGLTANVKFTFTCNTASTSLRQVSLDNVQLRPATPQEVDQFVD